VGEIVVYRSARIGANFGGEDGNVDRQVLLDEISRFCRQAGMAETTFGRRAVNDGKLISRLRFGGRVTTETLDRVRAFMSQPVARRSPIRAANASRASAAGTNGHAAAVPAGDALFRYGMHTLPSEISGTIGTSTSFAAWNAAIYVAQIEDERLSEAVASGRWLEATSEVPREHSGLWFWDESYVISRKRDAV
jgi:hypothetical protein